MAEISVTFPDGSVKPFDQNASAKDVAESISISLAKKKQFQLALMVN